ncbi:MAG: rhomboid family intramembrane serine protease [Crocinitomicaceae bacterium]
MKLIFINISIYIIIQVLSVIARLTGQNLSNLEINLFTLKTSPFEFLFSPWGVLTSIFSHFDFFHLLFNILFLYFIGKIAEYYLGSKSIIILYITGGIIGGLIEILAHTLFPNLNLLNSLVVGASGSIMAIFIAISVYKPTTEVNLYGIFKVKIIWLALVYFILDLIKIGTPDGIAHLAHIGGAITGFILLNNKGKFLNSINKLFTLKPKTNLKVKKGGRPLSDEEFNAVKKQNEELTNKILDKISKSGYESLTKSEKDFLFKQSKNG